MIGLASPRPLPLTSSKRDKSSSLSGRRRAPSLSLPFHFVKERQVLLSTESRRDKSSFLKGRRRAPLSDFVGESRFLLSSKESHRRKIDDWSGFANTPPFDFVKERQVLSPVAFGFTEGDREETSPSIRLSLSERADSCSRAKNPIVEESTISLRASPWSIGLARSETLPLFSPKSKEKRRAHHRFICRT